MTAEIAVFNASAIALAADSAVTTGFDDRVKIYNSAEKLFELSKHHPVGIMIYNNSTLCNAPWELIIKSYRKQLGNRSFAHLKDYADDLFTYIANNKAIITDEMRSQSVEKIIETEIRKVVLEVNNNEVVMYMQTNRQEPTFDIFHSLLKNRIESKINIIDSMPYLNGFNSSNIDEVENSIMTIIEKIIEEQIPKEPGHSVPDELKSALILYFTKLVYKQSSCDIYSGIVFAGYGDDEYYPSLVSLHIHGIYQDKPLYYFIESKSHNNTPLSAIIPFAQEEEVVSFIEGCNSSISDFTQTLANELVNRARHFVDNQVIQHLHADERERLINEINQLWPALLGDFIHKRQRFVIEKHVDKVISMLSSLSKHDLAYMAESLVNLTAFKRKVSNEHDTVGGPIDVAVISKGDGFIWVKRKHYFKPELNSNFFNRNSI
ncbi:hypothetical protein I5O50_05900 [Serratia ureilytica]|uniref:hypothetical protein n=1 Tax=Serratia ureilytica TaxID=300181 RepID=UPI0018D684A3|nr:hypothetical protein [Serratia ureilytica]MBH2596606.1 hypothetical protein [Serratia ureilytica]